LLLDLLTVKTQIKSAGGKNSGSLASDLAHLRLRIAEAYKKGYFQAASMAEVALLEIEYRHTPEIARSRLTKLEESCRARGYIAIANSASAVLANKARTS
jgi:hypothetical protein